MKLFVTTFFVLATLAIFTQAEAQTLGSCQIFPSNNPWNQRIDSLPVHWNSDKYIASVGVSIHVHPDFGSDASYGIPWVAVNGGQPMVPIDLSNGFTDQSDPGPMPIPPNAPVEGGGVGDAHVLVVDTSNRHLYELYQGIKGSGSGWAATSSAVFGLDSNNYRPDGWTSCDAAGLPIWPGLVRKYECDAGEIKHALRFTIGGKNSNGGFKNISQKGWIFPARHEAGGTTDTTAMPMGLRLRLKASFDDSKFTGDAKVISTALKKYGMILADNGSPWFISGETNTSWPDNDIAQLKSIMGSDFEVVYTGPVRTQPNQFADPVLPIPIGSGILHLTSNPIDFGKVVVGVADTMALTISNSGDGPLIVSTITPLNLNGDFTLLSFALFTSLPDTLQPGANLSAPVQFKPSKVVWDTLKFDLKISGTPGQTSDTIVTILGQGIPPASVAAAAEAEPFTLYPNPSSGLLTISVAEIAGPAQLDITDQLGRTVLRETTQPGGEALDLRGLPNGAYFARMHNEKVSAEQRIILAR
jgi:hypothetical protein